MEIQVVVVEPTAKETVIDTNVVIEKVITSISNISLIKLYSTFISLFRVTLLENGDQ